MKKDIDEYLKLEEKLESLEHAPAGISQDPNLLSEIQVLKQDIGTRLKKIVSSVEESGLVKDMPKEIQSVYMEIKKSTGTLQGSIP